MPKISIIMPSLNVGKYIRKCIESVVNQTLKDIEIICVDAGSSDGTLEILKEYENKDSRIKVIVSDKKSYGYQMNIGMLAASGEYIGIVETDDFVDVNMFEELYSYTVKDSIDFVKSSHYSYSDITGIEINILNSNSKLDDCFEKTIDLKCSTNLRLADTVNIWSAIYNRQFLNANNILFNETPGASYQDLSFSVLVGLTADSCVYTNKCYYHYRIDNINSSVKSDSKITCVCDEYRYIFEYLKKYNMDTPEIRTAINKFKLSTYHWNYVRLSNSSREGFLAAIADEMKEYNDIKLEGKDKEYYKLLTDKSMISVFNEKEKEDRIWNSDLIAQIQSGKKYGIIGAGNILNRLIALQKITGSDFIDYISDNSPKKQGNIVNGYVILSVEEAVSRNSEFYMIATLNYCSEIKQQLMNLGINEKRIIPLDRLYPLSDLIELIK